MLPAGFLCVVILLPLLTGAALALLPKLPVRAVRWTTALATALTSVLCWVLLCAGTSGQVGSGFLLTLGLDGPGRFFVGIVATLWPLTVCYAFGYMKDDTRQKAFFGCFTMAYGATLGVGLAGNLPTLLLFNLLLTLATAPLIRHTQTEEAKKAARLYLILMLSGLLLALGVTVWLGFSGAGGPFAAGGQLHRSDGLVQAFYALGFVGFGVNAAIVPLHFWLPKAACAPTPVTALLNDVTVANVGVFAILRLTRYVFDPTQLIGTPSQTVVLSLAMLTMLIGAVVAVRERHWKRRLAWSTMANVSYILFAIALMTHRGAAAGLVHVAFHACFKILTIFCAGAVQHQTGRERVSELEGLGRSMPLTFGCFTLASLALIGIPPFSGFISKWGILTAAAEAGTWQAWLGAGLLLLAALHAAVYMLSTVVRAWFPRKGVERPAASEPTRAMAVPMALLACGILACTVFAQAIITAAAQFIQ